MKKPGQQPRQFFILSSPRVCSNLFFAFWTFRLIRRVYPQRLAPVRAAQTRSPQREYAVPPPFYAPGAEITQGINLAHAYALKVKHGVVRMCLRGGICSCAGAENTGSSLCILQASLIHFRMVHGLFHVLVMIIWISVIFINKSCWCCEYWRYEHAVWIVIIVFIYKISVLYAEDGCKTTCG